MRWLWLLLLSSCALQVQLGGEDPQDSPAQAETPTQPLAIEPKVVQPGLKVTPLDLRANNLLPSLMSRTAAGDVVFADGEALVLVSRSGTARFPLDGKVGLVRAIHVVNDTFLLASEHGLFACVIDEDRMPCEDMDEPSEHHSSRPHVLGFSSLPGGRVLYAEDEGVGSLKIGLGLQGPLQHLKAHVAGTTRAWPFILLAEAPWACELDRAPPGATLCDQREPFAARVSQAIQIDAQTTAVATFGAGVRIRIGTQWQTWNAASGLADDRVNDLIVWQGELWAATESGLSRFSSQALDTSDAGSEPIVALAVNEDGTLLAAVGRPESRLVRIARR